MVMDLVGNAARYRGTHEVLDRALSALQSVPWGKLEDGRHELAEGVFAILSSYTTEPAEAGRYEGHRQHADIQLVLQGQETIYWSPAAQLEVAEDYDPQGDILFFREPETDQGASAPLPARPGLFVLLYPEDAHKPGRVWGSPQQVRKAVLKVRL